jgi:hypothetical protein
VYEICDVSGQGVALLKRWTVAFTAPQLLWPSTMISFVPKTAAEFKSGQAIRCHEMSGDAHHEQAPGF